MQVRIEDLCIDHNRTILDALKQINMNAHGIVFVTNNDRFTGTLSDGDIRRALISGIDRNHSIESICNKNASYLNVNASDSKIQQMLSEKIHIIPLLDIDNKVVDYSSTFRLRRIPLMEPLLGGNELEYVTHCIKTNWISSQGAYVQKFQEMLSDICRMEHCLATSNGTVSLHLALEALGIGEGDEVIVPDLTFGASVNSIIHANATPILVDIDKDTWNISPKEIRKSITPQTKAIMPVHLYGNPCDMDEIMKIAKEFNLLVIEDCAEALGSKINGKPVGCFGDAAAFSFFGNKVITCGEGGAVLFKDSSIYKRAAILRDHGMSKDKRYWHEEIGYNYRLTNIQAAIGCAQLEQFSTFRNNRRHIFELYDNYLLSSGFFKKQNISEGNETSYWLYTVCLHENVNIDRDKLMEQLQLKGIDTRPVFYPMNLMPAFNNIAKYTGQGISEYISSRGISLPSSINLDDSEIARVCECMLEIIRDNKR